MRFLKDGPPVPDDLLFARDEGRVIFFCGAGVSRARAGLSDFFGLADDVLQIKASHSAKDLRSFSTIRNAEIQEPKPTVNAFSLLVHSEEEDDTHSPVISTDEIEGEQSSFEASASDQEILLSEIDENVCIAIFNPSIGAINRSSEPSKEDQTNG